MLESYLIPCAVLWMGLSLSVVLRRKSSTSECRRTSVCVRSHCYIFSSWTRFLMFTLCGAVMMMSELTTGDALRTRSLLHQRDMYIVPMVSHTDSHCKAIHCPTRRRMMFLLSSCGNCKKEYSRPTHC